MRSSLLWGVEVVRFALETFRAGNAEAKGVDVISASIFCGERDVDIVFSECGAVERWGFEDAGNVQSVEGL